eukprot:TRINITY_DN47411_c0_g1_i1.p1 TRINITY_DN47411_c0_g1~~TRINITY_DN47411_c0_g1_i1.p1  ORF type:complete len:532 (+),score=129.69 TRINITY_DN47411_c0_g1_i1:102-1598(+)
MAADGWAYTSESFAYDSDAPEEAGSPFCNGSGTFSSARIGDDQDQESPPVRGCISRSATTGSRQVSFHIPAVSKPGKTLATPPVGSAEGAQQGSAAESGATAAGGARAPPRAADGAADLEIQLLRSRINALESQLQSCTRTLEQVSRRAVAAEAVYGVCRTFLQTAAALFRDLLGTPQQKALAARCPPRGEKCAAETPPTGPLPPPPPPRELHLPVAPTQGTVAEIDTALRGLLDRMQQLVSAVAAPGGEKCPPTPDPLASHCGADGRGALHHRDRQHSLRNFIVSVNPSALSPPPERLTLSAVLPGAPQPKAYSSELRPRSAPPERLPMRGLPHQADQLLPFPRRPQSAGGGWGGSTGGVGLRGHAGMARLGEQLAAAGVLGSPQQECSASPCPAAGSLTLHRRKSRESAPDSSTSSAPRRYSVAALRRASLAKQAMEGGTGPGTDRHAVLRGGGSAAAKRDDPGSPPVGLWETSDSPPLVTKGVRPQSAPPRRLAA